MQTSVQEIFLPKFPSLTRILTVNLTEQSVYFCVGFSLLRIFLRSKKNFAFFEGFNQSICFILDSLCKSSTPEVRSNLELYLNIIKTINKSPDDEKSEIWLSACISPQYTNSLLCITNTGHYIAYYLAQYNNLDFNEVASKDPCQIFKLLTDYFFVFIHIIWDSDDYLYEQSQNSESYIIYIYYNIQHKHFFLLQQTEDKLENIQLITVENYRKTLSIFADSSKDRKAADSMASASTFQNSFQADRIDKFPSFCKFLECMGQVLVDNGLFTQGVKSALDEAVEEDEFLASLEEVRRMKGIEEVFCEEHRVNVYLKLNCNVKHCAECIFDKILKEFNRNNYKIYCPCGNQIAPKEVDDIKKDFRYQEFYARNRMN